MICASCGGEVTWRGPISALTHTECERCGAQNNQIPEPHYDEFGCVECDWGEQLCHCGHNSTGEA